MSRRSSTGSRRRRAASSATTGRGLHLDAFSGIAGNMFLGAMLDLGLPRKPFESALADGLGGRGVSFRLRVSRVRRGALAARYVRVEVPRAAAAQRGHGRHWREIRRSIEDSRLDADVRARAISIFAGLAEAEAKVHGTAVEKVHFHEVGAVDAIVDICGAALALQQMGIERVSCTPLAIGHGTVGTEHGRLPLPAPATLELLRGLPVTAADVPWETVTPTGAAIARAVVDRFDTLPAMTVEAVGLGAGDDRPGPLPNVLRAVLGSGEGWVRDRVVSLEANVDDMNPEHFDYAMERLFESGALDVTLQHVQMKKNRPGFALEVLAPPASARVVAGVLFAETTTLGVRIRELERLVLHREILRVETPFGQIRVKRARGPEGRVADAPEYDDCRRAARRSGRPLREVVRAAERAAAKIPERPSKAR